MYMSYRCFYFIYSSMVNKKYKSEKNIHPSPLFTPACPHRLP